MKKKKCALRMAAAAVLLAMCVTVIPAEQVQAVNLQSELYTMKYDQVSPCTWHNDAEHLNKQKVTLSKTEKKGKLVIQKADEKTLSKLHEMIVCAATSKKEYDVILQVKGKKAAAKDLMWEVKKKLGHINKCDVQLDYSESGPVKKSSKGSYYEFRIEPSEAKDYYYMCKVIESVMNWAHKGTFKYRDPLTDKVLTFPWMSASIHFCDLTPEAKIYVLDQARVLDYSVLNRRERPAKKLNDGAGMSKAGVSEWGDNGSARGGWQTTKKLSEGKLKSKYDGYIVQQGATYNPASKTEVILIWLLDRINIRSEPNSSYDEYYGKDDTKTGFLVKESNGNYISYTIDRRIHAGQRSWLGAYDESASLFNTTYFMFSLEYIEHLKQQEEKVNNLLNGLKFTLPQGAKQLKEGPSLLVDFTGSYIFYVVYLTEDLPSWEKEQCRLASDPAGVVTAYWNQALNCWIEAKLCDADGKQIYDEEFAALNSTDFECLAPHQRAFDSNGNIRWNYLKTDFDDDEAYMDDEDEDYSW